MSLMLIILIIAAVLSSCSNNPPLNSRPALAETGLSMAYHYTMGDIYDFRTFKRSIGVERFLPTR